MFSMTPQTRRKLRRAMSAARAATFCAAMRRSRDDEQVGARQHPCQPHLHVAGARRHVDEQVVELAPVHVAQELLDRLGEHQAPPHQRGVLLDQEAGADDLQQPAPDRALVGDDLRLVAALDGLASSRSSMPSRRGTEKPQMSASSTPTVNPSRGDRGGQVDGDRALADATLAAGDGQDPGRRAGSRCRARSRGRSSAP